MAKQELTAERLREVLSYEPESGLFTWRVATGRRVHVGDVAGYTSRRGYVLVAVDGRQYRAHRLVFLYMTGKWPPADVDHKYGVRNDNRWSEIRVATGAQNAQNQRKAHSGSRCGLLGVTEEAGRFRSRIKIDGKKKHLGLFETPEQAHDAYLASKVRLHPFQTLIESAS